MSRSETGTLARVVPGHPRPRGPVYLTGRKTVHCQRSTVVRGHWAPSLRHDGTPGTRDQVAQVRHDFGVGLEPGDPGMLGLFGSLESVEPMAGVVVFQASQADSGLGLGLGGAVSQLSQAGAGLARAIERWLPAVALGSPGPPASLFGDRPGLEHVGELFGSGLVVSPEPREAFSGCCQFAGGLALTGGNGTEQADIAGSVGAGGGVDLAQGLGQDRPHRGQVVCRAEARAENLGGRLLGPLRPRTWASTSFTPGGAT